MVNELTESKNKLNLPIDKWARQTNIQDAQKEHITERLQKDKHKENKTPSILNKQEQTRE